MYWLLLALRLTKMSKSNKIQVSNKVEALSLDKPNKKQKQNPWKQNQNIKTISSNR